MTNEEVLACGGAALDAWSKRVFGASVVVRASCYREIENYQAIHGWGGSDDPRRPVVMKGAKWRIIAVYSNASPASPNGWCEAVFRRYLIMRRATAFTREEYEQIAHPILRRLRAKHLSATHYLDKVANWPGSHSDPCALVGGRFRWLAPAQIQYLRKLHDIRQKTAEIEARAIRLAAQ